MGRLQIFARLLQIIHWWKLSKTQLSKITQSGGFFGSFCTINEGWFVTDKECTPAIGQED